MTRQLLGLASSRPAQVDSYWKQQAAGQGSIRGDGLACCPKALLLPVTRKGAAGCRMHPLIPNLSSQPTNKRPTNHPM